jgi:hypothetical protein
MEGRALCVAEDGAMHCSPQDRVFGYIKDEDVFGPLARLSPTLPSRLWKWH